MYLGKVNEMIGCIGVKVQDSLAGSEPYDVTAVITVNLDGVPDIRKN
jgi:hypothetical protein